MWDSWHHTVVICASMENPILGNNQSGSHNSATNPTIMLLEPD
jgi:hypothetical protein